MNDRGLQPFRSRFFSFFCFFLTSLHSYRSVRMFLFFRYLVFDLTPYEYHYTEAYISVYNIQSETGAFEEKKKAWQETRGYFAANRNKGYDRVLDRNRFDARRGTTAPKARVPGAAKPLPPPTRFLTLAVTVSRYGGGGQPRVVTRLPLLALPRGCSSPRLTVGEFWRVGGAASPLQLHHLDPGSRVYRSFQLRLAVNIHPPISLTSRSTSIPEVVYIGHSTSTSIPDVVRGMR